MHKSFAQDLIYDSEYLVGTSRYFDQSIFFFKTWKETYTAAAATIDGEYFSIQYSMRGSSIKYLAKLKVTKSECASFEYQFKNCQGEGDVI